MGAPAGYIPVPDDIRCRCFKQWQEADGTYWCCGESETVKEIAELRRLSADCEVSPELIGIRVRNTYQQGTPTEKRP